jgi:hypothetical protein
MAELSITSDVALLYPYLTQIVVGHEGLVGNPGIHDSLEVVADAQGKTPLGEFLSDDEPVEVGDDRLGGRNESKPFLPRRRHRRSGWLGSGLRRDVGDRLGGAEAADVDEGVDAAFVQRNAWVVAEVAVDGVLVGHGDIEIGDVPRPPHGRWSNATQKRDRHAS